MMTKKVRAQSTDSESTSTYGDFLALFLSSFVTLSKPSRNSLQVTLLISSSSAWKLNLLSDTELKQVLNRLIIYIDLCRHIQHWTQPGTSL